MHPRDSETDYSATNAYGGALGAQTTPGATTQDGAA
jgi:hypothetical protein